MMNPVVVKPTMQMQIKKHSFKAFQILFLAVILLLTYIPILVMALTSFSKDPMGYRLTGFTFEWYGKIFTDVQLRDSIVFTLEITFLSTIISTIFGTASAIGINALNKKAKKRFIILNNVPILNADIVTAAFLLVIFQIFSIITKTNIIASFPFVTTLIAHVLFSTPYVVLSVLPKLSKDDSIFEAAMDLGCSPRKALAKVMIPNISAGVISGALLAFTMSIDDFIITYFVCGSKTNFSTWLYGNLRTMRNAPWNKACAYNTILMFITFTLIIAYQLIGTKKNNKKRG